MVFGGATNGNRSTRTIRATVVKYRYAENILDNARRIGRMKATKWTLRSLFCKRSVPEGLTK